jgi:peptidoglycan/xylan/chitin deacetylase (PgdA/CDA1 family)
MKLFSKVTTLFALPLLLLSSCTAENTSTPVASTPAPGETRVARWQDDKKAAFLLMFDDGWPSHWQVAVPELQKRGMTGTFYVCPAKGEYKKFENTWVKDVVAAGMVLGNHTMTHNGFQGEADTEMEIGDTTRYILEKVPGKNPRLISFALPGVKDYDYGGVPLKDVLAKYNLVSRGDFRDHGANYHIKTLEKYVELADKAIASGGLEYIVYHGLERITPNWGYQDMWAVKQDVFSSFLDALQERRDRGDLWITDHISSHQYETERDTAKVSVLENSVKKIRLALKTEADPQLYDLPLTLITQVPASWKKCKIAQGEKMQVIEVTQGAVRFQAQPDGSPISMQPEA